MVVAYPALDPHIPKKTEQRIQDGGGRVDEAVVVAYHVTKEHPLDLPPNADVRDRHRPVQGLGVESIGQEGYLSIIPTLAL
jgi:hypothetical protein